MPKVVSCIAYVVVALAFSISVVFPLVFMYADPFAAPTAVAATRALQGVTGGLGRVAGVLPYDYWKEALAYESDYPIPYLFLSVLMLVGAIPSELAMFIPAAGAGSIVYFVLAEFFLRKRAHAREYATLLSALFYAFTVSTRIYSWYTGRAVLGVIFFTYFLFCYVRFLDGRVYGRPNRSWVLTSFLFVLAIGWTYYTATLVVVGTSLFLIVSALFLRRMRGSIDHGVLLVAAGLLLSITSPTIIRLIGQFKPTLYFYNLATYTGYLLSKFGIHAWSGQEAEKLLEERVDMDVLSIWGRRIAFAVQYSSLIATVAIVISGFKSKGRGVASRIGLFSLVILFAGISEFLLYFAAGTNPGFRLALLFSPIPALFLVERFVTRHGGFESRKMSVIVLLVVLTISLGCCGSINSFWLYGGNGAKPFVYREVYPISNWMLAHSSNNTPVTLTGDVYYMANIFFIASIQAKVDNVIPQPLLEDAISLDDSWRSGHIEVFFTQMNERGITYLLVPQDDGPIRGDTWGWTVEPPVTSTFASVPLNTVYTDGYTRLYSSAGTGSGS